MPESKVKSFQKGIFQLLGDFITKAVFWYCVILRIKLNLFILTSDFKGNIPSPFVTLSPKPNAGIVSLSLNGSSVSPRIQIT